MYTIYPRIQSFVSLVNKNALQFMNIEQKTENILFLVKCLVANKLYNFSFNKSAIKSDNFYAK